MKELSIEEKAKAYDEAIERAKSVYNETAIPSATTKGICTYIFPELKESKDERIRKELLEHCKNQAKPYIQTGNKCPQIQSWIDWLEKQGDKNSQVILPTFTFDDILALQCCMETVKKVQEDKDLYEKLNDLHGRVYDAYHLEKQGEQKSAKNILEAWKDMRLEVYQQASGNRHELNYSDDTTKMFSLNDIDEIIEKLMK